MTALLCLFSIPKGFLCTFIGFVSIKLLLFLFLGLSTCNFDNSSNSPPPPLPTHTRVHFEWNNRSLRHENWYKCPNLKKDIIKINCDEALQILIFGFGVITLLWLSYMNICTCVCYVSFNTNLNLYIKKKHLASPPMYLDGHFSHYVRIVLKQ